LYFSGLSSGLDTLDGQLPSIGETDRGM